MIAELMPLLMFATLGGSLLMGYPVALTLAGTALAFAGIGISLEIFEPAYLRAFPNRILGAMRNQVLTSVPLFILMGAVLEQSGIAKELLQTTQKILASIKGGLAYAVILVGALLAASTGIVGATVVTMTMLALPGMLEQGYDKRLASGIIAASGTLGQIIPPSIILIVLADVIANANAEAARSSGNVPNPVSVGDLFAAALIPGLILVAAYCLLVAACTRLKPNLLPAATDKPEIPSLKTIILALGAPLMLIISVLGSILGGLASPTEAASIGASGAILLAGMKQAKKNNALLIIACGCGAFILASSAASLIHAPWKTALALAACLSLSASLLTSLYLLHQNNRLIPTLIPAAQMTSMVFLILIGAALFSIVFRGLGGDTQIEKLLSAIPGGFWGAIATCMLALFVLGFFLDFLEITLILIPLLAPHLIKLGADPIWLGVLIAINLQTSFLTPPFGFALFYLKGAAPPELHSSDIWRGACPFIALQLLVLALIAAFPGLIWKPA